MTIILTFLLGVILGYLLPKKKKVESKSEVLSTLTTKTTIPGPGTPGGPNQPH